MRKIRTTVSLPLNVYNQMEDLAVKMFGTRKVSKVVEWMFYYRIDVIEFNRWMAKHHAALMYHFKAIQEAAEKESTPRTPRKKEIIEVAQ